MTDHPSEEAFEFEKYLIEDPQQWDVPGEAWEIYQKEMPGPVGISKHPEKGWAVIASCGQGPMVLWKQSLSAEDTRALMMELIKIIKDLGWAAGIPQLGENDVVPGMVIGIPEYVEGVLDYIPEGFSDRFKNE